MKRQTGKRVATALAFAGLMGLTACGSGSNNNNGLGYLGGALSGSGAQVSLSPMIQFSGTAMLDATGGITAGTNGSSLYMQPVSASPAANGPLQPCTLNGAYTAGRCGADANLGISINGNPGYGGYPMGGTMYPTMGTNQVSINGMLQFNSTAWNFLQSQLASMGSGYSGYQISMPYLPNAGTPYPYYPGGTYGMTGGNLSSIQIVGTGGSGLGMGVASAQAALSSGAQTGGAPNVLYAGAVILTINGMPVYVPF